MAMATTRGLDNAVCTRHRTSVSYTHLDVYKRQVQIAPEAALGQDEATIAYRARKNGHASALVLEAVAPDGYAGKIRLLIALGIDGAVSYTHLDVYKRQDKNQ